MRSLSNVFKCTEVRLDGSYYFQNAISAFAKNMTECLHPAKKEDGFDRIVAEAKAQEIIDQAQRQAEEIIRRASEAARVMEEDAVSKVSQEMRKGYECGYEKGLAAGIEEAIARNRGAIEEIKRLISELEAQKDEMFAKSESSIKSLAVGIARKLLGRELESDPEAIEDIFRNAVKCLKTPQEWVKLTVSRLDAEYVERNAEALREMVCGAKSIRIEAVEDAPRGTCVIETPQGIIDASIEAQLERVEKLL